MSTQTQSTKDQRIQRRRSEILTAGGGLSPISQGINAAFGAPLIEGLPYTRAEVVYAVRNEMARTVDDVLSRRTRARTIS